MAQRAIEHFDEEALDARNPLLNDIEKRDDFHAHRWRCIARPERAAETLGPCWRLELELVSATELASGSPTYVFDPSSDFAVRVYMDDQVKYTTSSVRHTSSPVWNHSAHLDFAIPKSCVRLEVVDARKDESIAFVEFVAGDLPVGKLFDGWLELRFMENLQDTVHDRLNTHRTVRDDQLAHTLTFEGDANVDTMAQYGVNKDFYFTKKARSKSLLGCCNNGKTGAGGAHTGFHLNAGELRVRVKLTRLGSWMDGMFSYALNPSAPKNYGRVRMTAEEGDLNAQAVADDLQRIKNRLWDDSGVAVVNYITYILTWRSFLLSFLITVIFVVTCCFTWLFVAAVPATLAMLLVLNSSSSLRTRMLYSGANAPLNQSGFALVASMGRSGEMYTFLTRVIADFEGSVTDDAALKLLAARCFRDGVPSVPLADLIKKLRDVPWVKITKKEDVKGNMLVWVDNQDDNCAPATVCSNPVGDMVEVRYDSSTPGRVSRNPERERVHRSRIRPRYAVNRNLMYFLPAKVESEVRTFHKQASQLRNSLLPILSSVADVLSWRSKKAALITLCILLVLAGCGLFIAIKEEGHEEETYWGHVATLVLANLDNFTVLVIGLAIMLPKASWLISLGAFFRMFSGLQKHHRRGPDTWKYYKPVGEAGATSRPTATAPPTASVQPVSTLPLPGAASAPKGPAKI
eukprot:TRINITY_DN3898_c0_g2_i4.p1 TRINITY_DN3898_c0_g2~~TRINITY_DN3898_c0_g2_i4.p1  ORF type:complete len:688 (-),score=73.24 TRINITY_DN3898_c0_g2_i4:175-2238(-)